MHKILGWKLKCLLFLLLLLVRCPIAVLWQNIGPLRRTRVLTAGVFEGGRGRPGAIVPASVEQSACGIGQHQNRSAAWFLVITWALQTCWKSLWAMTQHHVTRYNLVWDNSINNCDCVQGRKLWVLQAAIQNQD